MKIFKNIENIHKNILKKYSNDFSGITIKETKKFFIIETYFNLPKHISDYDFECKKILSKFYNDKKLIFKFPHNTINFYYNKKDLRKYIKPLQMLDKSYSNISKFNL